MGIESIIMLIVGIIIIGFLLYDWQDVDEVLKHMKHNGVLP